VIQISIAGNTKSTKEETEKAQIDRTVSKSGQQTFGQLFSSPVVHGRELDCESLLSPIHRAFRTL
jgi:hypothetical protein